MPKFRSFAALSVCKNCGRVVPSHFDYCTAAPCQVVLRQKRDEALRARLMKKGVIR